MLKEILASVAIVLTIAMYLPYIRAVRQGRTKPHAFSWVIWTLSAIVVFVAQLSDKAGVGAWPIGITSLVTGYIAFLAYRNRTDASVQRSDWSFIAIASVALVSWYLTSNPLVAVMLLTGVEVAGFGPTFRSAASHPHYERISFFLLASFRSALVISALENYTLTTVLFPAAKGIVSAVLVMTIWHYRYRVPLRNDCGGGA